MMERAGNYARTLAAVAAVVGGTTAVVVRWATADVRGEVADLHAEVVVRASSDSVRFERVMQVVELAVVALVEPDTSTERHAAIAELRRRRHVMPQRMGGL